MDNYERKISAYKKAVKAQDVREAAVIDTVEKSKKVLADHEDYPLSYREFVFWQSRYIGKKWWLFQGMILALFWYLLRDAGTSAEVQRNMSVAASVFALLIIPELWKNYRSSAMEIESASYYSLRQIYSARILLFALTDLTMVTAFFFATFRFELVSVEMFAISFLIPFSTSCCICFRLLCSKRFQLEEVAVFACILWMIVWLVISSQELIYRIIVLPLWSGLLVLALIYLIYCVRKTQVHCDSLWEVHRLWN